MRGRYATVGKPHPGEVNLRRGLTAQLTNASPAFFFDAFCACSLLLFALDDRPLPGIERLVALIFSEVGDMYDAFAACDAADPRMRSRFRQLG